MSSPVPDLRHLDLPDIAGEPLATIGEGDFCVAFAAGARWIVRVPKHEEAARALRREACVMPRIADALPLPAPRPTFHAATALGFAVHERVPGQELTRDRWYALPRERQREAARDIGCFLATLHALPTGLAPECGLEIVESTTRVATIRARAAELVYPFLPAAAVDSVDAAFDRIGNAAWFPEPVLLHGDFGPDHVLYDPRSERVSGVIDFGDIMIGDPAWDFIFVYEDYDEEILSLVLEHYDREPAAAMIPRVHAWYFLAAAQWTVWMREQNREAELREGLAEIPRAATIALRSAPPATR